MKVDVVLGRNSMGFASKVNALQLKTHSFLEKRSLPRPHRREGSRELFICSERPNSHSYLQLMFPR